MKIFKFGGASVKDAKGVRNLAAILGGYRDNLVIVVSAMGKTTNALESLTKNYFAGNAEGIRLDLNALRSYHFQITDELFDNQQNQVRKDIESDFEILESRLSRAPSLEFDYEYDQIVSLGEIVSTKIVSAYLNSEGIINQWMDIRYGLRTDTTWREANIDTSLSSNLIAKQFNFEKIRLYVTQGFIGSTSTDQTTTLGREGSDYTAAIIANFLNAESVTIWKDVPGIMNADPNKFEKTQKLDMLS